MRKIFVLLFTVIVMGVSAQQKESKIDFKAVDMNTAMKMAKESGKQIFCDFNTTWCGPCKTLFNDVFTDEEVGLFMNDKFISLYINAEAPEWVAVAKKYKITAYPTMLILSPDGTERHRMQGAMNKSKFLNEIYRYFDDKRSPEALKARYEKGERTAELIKDYVYDVLKSGDEKTGFEIVDNYFNSLSDNQKIAKENWFLFITFLRANDDVKCKYLIDNYKQFYSTNDKSVVDAQVFRIVRSTISPYISGYFVRENKFNQAEFEKVLAASEKFDIENRNILIATGNIAKARVETDLNPKDKCDNFINVCKKEIDNLDEAGYSLLLYNLPFMTLKASDRAKLKALELIANYETKYSKLASDNFMLNKVKESLQPVKRGDVIKFEKKVTFDKALSMAKKQNKLIFMDCFTTWCGPCKKLSEEVFTAQVIKEYFDKNFINLKVDMEKGEGIELAKSFGIKSYPTLLLINERGDVVHTKIGGAGVDEFLKEFKTANENYTK